MNRLNTRYTAPDFEQFEVEVERGFANSLKGATTSDYSSNDDHDDAYWSEHEVEI